MPLVNTRKIQLDGIVKSMISNRENDETIQFVVDDFKAKYEDESPQTMPKKQGFFAGEFTGGADVSEFTGLKGFAADVFQSTLGSRGLLGVAQLPGQFIGTRGILKSETMLQESRGQLFDQARTLVKKMRETSDPQELERLRQLSVGIDEALAEVGQATSGLERFAPTGKRALGTTLGAAATVAPIASGRLAQAGREALRGTSFMAGGALTEDRLPTKGELATGAILGPITPVVARGVRAFTGKVFEIVGGLSKRIAAGLGVTFDDIMRNPKIANETAQSLLTGNKTVGGILKTNSKELLNDVVNQRRLIRRNFGKALESLSEIQIPAVAVKNAGINALRKNGITIVNGKIDMSAAEFMTPLIQKRATGIINQINNLTKLDGKTLRNIINKADSLRFKTPGTDPDRLAFNALMYDLERGLSGAVSKVTPELKAANKVFTENMQIIEVMEQEFGKVKFANLKELNTFSKNIEKMLEKTGIAPDIIDDFFAKIGKDPTALRATEAVRRAFTGKLSAETPGVTRFELIRQISAGILAPKDVARISIIIARITNLSEKIVKPFIESLAKLQPIPRAILTRSFLEIYGDRGEEEQELNQ